MCTEMHGALLRGLVAAAGLVLAESVGASRSSEPAVSFRRIEGKGKQPGCREPQRASGNFGGSSKEKQIFKLLCLLSTQTKKFSSLRESD